MYAVPDVMLVVDYLRACSKLILEANFIAVIPAKAGIH
jgi:hypothetical protein